MSAFSRAGESITCPTCAAGPGERCVSRSGRTLMVTHDNRMRAERRGRSLAVRRYVSDQMAGRVS